MSSHHHGGALVPIAPPQQPQMITTRVDARLRMDLVLRGAPSELRDRLSHMLGAAGWQMHWTSEWSGLATKGNKVANALLGGFAQYHEMHFAFSTMPDGSTAVVLYRTGSGCMGGLWGMHQVRKSFSETSAYVHGGFVHSGHLLTSQGA